LQAIGFDFDHTLGIDNKLERTVALEVVRERAESNCVPFSPAVAQPVVEDALVAYRAGRATFDVAWASVCEKLLGPAEDPKQFVVDFRDRVLLGVGEHVQALPGAREVLESLRLAGVRCAILTNGWSPLQEAKAEAIGFEGPVLVSERIGARKPDLEAFAVLVKTLGVPADQVAYVGDDPFADIAGSAAAGLASVWFDWEGIPFPPGASRPAHVIHALDELLPLLQGREG
jgi:HAD superfamily hydrolase (TIGR01549 family)